MFWRSAATRAGLGRKNLFNRHARNASTSHSVKQATFPVKALAASLFGTTMLGAGYLAKGAFASDDVIHPAHYPWDFGGVADAFDHFSLRRGYEVYKNVCATCHSMKFMAFRHLVDATHTEAEAKALAAEFEYKDGPNDEGEMYDRPGRLSDYFPSPYENDAQARLANAGALPPDLSLISKARPHGPDYLFALLTGYREPPAGVEVKGALHYNPYFPGNAIAMARALSDGQVDYSDGTPATTSQMAKDVTTFLTWAAEPITEEKKQMGLKFVSMMFVAVAFVGYWKRLRFSALKTRKFEVSK